MLNFNSEDAFDEFMLALMDDLGERWYDGEVRKEYYYNVYGKRCDDDVPAVNPMAWRKLYGMP